MAVFARGAVRVVFACGVGGLACDRGVVGSAGVGRGSAGRAVRRVRPAVLQRVQPAPARAAHPRSAAGGVRHLRPQLQDAAVPAAPHAGAARTSQAARGSAAVREAVAEPAAAAARTPHAGAARASQAARGSAAIRQAVTEPAAAAARTPLPVARALDTTSEASSPRPPETVPSASSPR